MYQQQQYHTANYRGNIQNHDANLRSDSQQPSSYVAPQSQYSQASSQYRGIQRHYQPSGFVQSFYQRQPQSQQFQPSFQSQSQQSQQSFQPQFQQQFQQSFQPQFQQNQSNVASTNYHMANYRGNQQDHDVNLRSDSSQPSQHQFSGMNQSFGISQQGFR